MAHREERIWAQCLECRSPGLTVITLLFLILALVSGCFLAFGQYSRKVVVAGMLAPDKGAVEIKAPTDGVVEVMLVSQGERVGKGDKLLVVRPGVAGLDGALPGIHLLQENAAQIRQFQEMRSDELAAYAIRLEQLESDLRTRSAQARHLLARLGNEKTITKLLSDKAARLQILAERKLVSHTVLESARIESLQQQSLIQQLKQDLAASIQAREKLRIQSRLLGLEHRQQLAQFDLDLSKLSTQQIQLRSEQSVTLVSPVTGTISVIQKQTGQTVNRQQTVLAVIQAGSLLQAELNVPSRAAGFLQPGQAVNLRYDAFPYQKFGLQEAAVLQVSRTAVNSAGFGQPPGLDEPYFRVIALPVSQSIKAFGRQVPLKPGMQFRADVVLESRSLLQWLLEPLYIRGKS